MKATSELRSRSRAQQVTRESIVGTHYFADGHTTQETMGTYDVPTENSIIIDEVTPAYIKNVYHERMSVKGNMNATHWCNHREDDIEPNGVVKSGPWRSCGSESVATRVLFPANPLDSLIATGHDTLSDIAYDALPRVENIAGGFLIQNFLWEFGEVRDTLSPFLQPGALAKASSGHLTYAFGVAPFMSDMSTIYNSLICMKDMIDRWNKAAKDGTIYTYSRRLKEYDIDTRESYLYHTYTWSVGRAGQDYWNHVTRKVYLHLYVKPRYIDFDINKYVYYYKAMGLHKPIPAIWNAIPFSFVVDWVYPIGNYLDDLFSDDEFLPFAILEDACLSCKVEVKESKRARDERLLNNHQWYTVGHGGATIETTRSVYERRRIVAPMPVNRVDNPSFRLPGTTKWLLGASLIHANVH